MILQIKRGNRVIAESADFSYSPSLQEVRKLTCEVVSVVPIEFKAYNSKSESEYDTVVYNGNTFILYQAPSGDNLNEAGKYKYSLLFYGKEVLLQNVAFLDIVSGTGGEINKIRYTHGGLFQFWGDAKQLAARIEANIESYNASLGAGYTGIGTWTLNVDAEGDLTEDMIDISDGTNLFEALKNFYDKFYLNYYFSTTANGGIITITDKTRPSVNWTFKQGDGGGAVKVSSSVDTSTPVITRIIPQGGSRNVPPEYKKDAKPADESRYCPYILLPNDSDGNIRYFIDSEYGLKNYGVRGKTISNTFSGIYPSIRGKKLGDLYPSGLPEWDTYKADGEPDPQSGKVAGEGASAATRIDKIIGSTPIKSDDSDSFFIYMTSPGFNLGYKVYEDGDSSDKINDNVQPQYKPHAMFDKYRDFESFDIYGTRAYYDQPVNVTATFSGKMLFSVLPIGSDAVGKKVKINLRMVTNRVLGQASPLKEVVIGEEGATGMLEIPYDKTALVGYIEKGQNTTVTIRVEFTFDSDVPARSCKIGFSEEMTCNIHFGNQDGSQDRFYYKYASVTDAVFSMRTGTYTGTEFKINKNGIIPLYGKVNGDTGKTEEDVAMFNKGARYKISCYRTDSDNAKLPLYTDGKSPSIAAGTEFVILNIVMPESYVTMAENTLEKAALDYLSRYDHENRTVSLDISSGFVAEHPNLFIDFIEGNMLKVRDDGIGVFDFSDNGQIVDMQLQIQSLEIKYSKENMFPSYSCTIARRKILSFYERLAQENQTASTQNTTNVTLGGSGTGSGTNIFSEQLLNDFIASFQKFNGWFEWDEVNQALRCKSAFYTNQWISALGAQSGSGEPGGGEGGLIKAVYGFADLGKTFDDSNLSNTFNAYTINEIWKLAKEGGMNTDKLWQELGKDDPTKKIHISHLPDNKFVTLDTEQTVTASKIFTGQLSTANVVPSVNNASTLGLESKRWENIYAVDANISGTVKTQALQVGDIKIIYDSVNKAVTFEHADGNTEIGFYTRGWISALGVSPGGSGGSGGDGSGVIKTVYSFANLTDGTTFSDSDLDNTFNAYTIKKLYDMAGQGGLDADAMWAELKKADSSKVIDASHIPTSVLDGRWVTLSTNQTITGQKTFTQQLKSTVATGLSPLIVSSNTLVNNLNADLLDGYHQSAFLRADGVNQHVTLTGGNGDTEGYRLVLEATVIGGWSINSMTFLVNSRHSGTGIISMVFHTTNQESTNYTGALYYYGSTNSFGNTMWRLFYNTTTKKIRLFLHYYDHNDCHVSILNRRGVTTNISNGTWYTTLPSDNGNELPSYYNRSDTTGSLATSRTLWGQPFNGTANVSGNMTGVGNITMSGQLTSTVASGTAPFIVVSNTVVGNLNADMVDGLHLSDFDGRYVNVTGDTMTGDLTMNNTKGFNIGGGTRVVKTSGNWIHGGGDIASSTDANLRFGSWLGIGWYPTISGQTVAQGENAMWLNVRTGVLNVAGGIKESNICIGRVDSNGNYNINCAGEISRYDHHLYLQRNSGKNLIMCTGGGLAGIGTDSPRAKLDVAGNVYSTGFFYSTVGTGTAPYQCSSTTLNTNLNADLLDGYHISQISLGYPSGHIKHRVGPFGGGQDKNWRKIVTYVNTTGGQYKACTIIGTIWINHGNHSQGQVTEIPFQVVLYAYGGTANSQVNGNYLYIPPYCTFDCIRIVRYASNSWELQIRQYSDWTTINCEYSAFSTGGGTINAGQFSTDIHTSTVTNAYNSNVTTPQSHSVWGVTRTFYIQDYHSVNTGAGVSVNGGSNCYLKLPSTTRFSRIDFSTPNANIRHSGNDNGNEVGSSTLSNLVIDSWHGVSFTTTCSSTYQNKIAMSVNCRTGRVTANNFHAATNITADGAITAKASSSDIRLKTDIQGYDAMGIIRKFRSVKYHWNAIAKENSEVFNHDNWNYGLIAQDLLSGGYSQWVKDTFNDYYTIDYERLIPVVWKGLQEVDDEVTRLKKRVRELEKRLGINN